jgi:hypothetical protein
MRRKLNMLDTNQRERIVLTGKVFGNNKRKEARS